MSRDQQPMTSTDSLSPVPSRLNQLTAVGMLLASFPLIFLGGLTTSHGAGMAVPDWPNTYGYNMWLFPPSMWIGGIFYEHTHRLLGTLVGLLSIAFVLACYAPARKPGVRKAVGITAIASLVVTVALLLVPATLDPNHHLQHVTSGTGAIFAIAGLAWLYRRREARTWVRRFSILILACIIVQGILGGLRVTEVNIHLAVIHGIFAQLVLCMLALAAIVSSPWWFAAPDLSEASAKSRAIFRIAGLTFGLILAQLVVGAMMRHYQAGLAIPDLPLAYGKLLPPTTSEGLAAANDARVALHDATLKPVTLSQIWLHFGHRIGALVVSAAVILLGVIGIKLAAGQTRVTVLSITLLVLLAIQLTLGLLTVYYRKPADITTLHHTVGALCLMATFILGVWAARLFARTAVSTAPSPSTSVPVPPSKSILTPPAYRT